MDKRVHHAVADLLRRQRIGLRGIEHGKFRKQRRMHEGKLGVQGAIRDDRSVVHLGSGRRNRQNRSEGDRPLCLLAVTGDNLPGISLMGNGCGDKLCPVDHGTAADGQQKIDFIFARRLHTPHQRLIGRIGLNASKFFHRAALKRRPDLIIYAVALDAAASVGHQNLCPGGNFSGNILDPSLAKKNFCRVIKRKIVHIPSFCEMDCKSLRKDSKGWAPVIWYWLLTMNRGIPVRPSKRPSFAA